MTNVLASNNSNHTADSIFFLHSYPDIPHNTKMHWKNKTADQTNCQRVHRTTIAEDYTHASDKRYRHE